MKISESRMLKAGLWGLVTVMLVTVASTPVLNAVNVWADENSEAELPAGQEAAIKEQCADIKNILSTLQHTDARARVYLGQHYEAILNNFIMPLNVRLVENNISGNNLIDNQANFVVAQTKFKNDYVSYQQELESLVSVDCKAEPRRFYRKLTEVREKRAAVEKDTERLRDLMTEQVNLTTKLKESL